MLTEQQTDTKQAVIFHFSLQIRTEEGFSIRGEAGMNKTTTGIPQRASRQPDVTEDVDDQLPQAMPRSQIRWRATQAGQDVLAPTGCTQDAVVPVVSHRVSGSTRAGLWVVLLLCIAFLFNGIVLPGFNNLINQFHYGDARIATYDIASKHWITEDDKGKIRVYIVSQDGQHVQVLDSILGSNTNHALVTLTDQGSNIVMSVNGTQTAFIIPDGHGGYKWGGN